MLAFFRRSVFAQTARAQRSVDSHSEPPPMASHANAETPGASSQGEAPSVKADAGESGAARTADGKSDLKSSIMTILKSDAPVHDAGKTKMDELAEKRRALQSQRKKLTADLRNESRKRKRIQQRAQYLTDDDLVEAIAMRANRKKPKQIRLRLHRKRSPAEPRER